MTDAELIQLLESKLPQELTPAEVTLVRSRLGHSPALQKSLRDRLLIDESLNQVLGEIQLAPEVILARGQRAGRGAPAPRWLLWSIALVLLIAAGWGLKTMLLPVGWPGPVAQREGDSPAQKSPSINTPPGSPDDLENVKANQIPPPAPGELLQLNTKLRPGWLVFEAEHYQQSRNIQVVTANGNGFVTPTINSRDAQLDYEFNVPAAGNYLIEMQYRSLRNARVEILVNDVPLIYGRYNMLTLPTSPSLSGDPLVGWSRVQQELPFKTGKNKLTLRGSSYTSRSYVLFPDLDRIALQTEAKLDEFETESLSKSEPWNTTKYLGSPPRPFIELAHEHHRYWGPSLSKTGFREWFSTANGFKSETTRRWDATLLTIDGAARLRAPLLPDHLLRLVVSETNNQFRLHLWNGLQGYSLQLYDWQNQAWVAYRVERKKLSDPRPSKYEFASSDDKHYFLLHAADQPHRVELRCTHTRLTLSHVGVPLLDLPWDGPEPEVVLETRGVLHGFALQRVSDAGPPPLPELPAVTTTWENPAEQEWYAHEGLPSAFVKRTDGAVELSSLERTDKDQWATADLQLRGPSLIECEIEVMEPGASLILATKENIPRYAITALRDRRSGQIMWKLQSPFDPNFEAETNHLELPAPLSGQRAWIRIVQGAGLIRYWLSTDGVTWGKCGEPAQDTEGSCERLGLCLARGDRPRGMILHQVTIRELPLLAGLVEQEILAKVPRLKFETTPAAWAAQIENLRPADIAAADWRRACALKTIALGQGRQVANLLLAQLLDEALAAIPAGNDPATRHAELEKKLALLRETAWIANAVLPADQYQPGEFLPERYDQLARTLALQGQSAAWTRIWYEWVTAPGWFGVPRFTEWQHLAREDLLQGVYSSEPARVRDLYHFTQTIFPRLTFLPWVENWLISKQPNLLPTAEMTGEPYEYRNLDRRHPYIEQIDKESFNTMAELNSAIGSKALRDAAQLITQAGPHDGGGLLPDQHDPDLLVALPAAIRLALQQEPELSQVLVAEYTQVGLLRFRKAELEGDLAVMQNLVNQYPGTSAAGAAHAWLADRALSGGDFGSALANYAAALPTAPPELAAGIPARQRLAAALLGRDLGAPITATVTLGETKLAPVEFEAQLRTLREQHQRDAGDPAPTELRAPDAGKLELKKLATTEGDSGDKVGEFPETLNLMFEQGKRFDWAARQMALVPWGDKLLWSNRYQVSLYDQAGKRLWKTALDNDHGRAHDWLFVPMRPLARGDRVFARRLTRAGPDLAALDLNSGKLLWQTRPGLVVISDPLWVNEELRLLSINRLDQEAQIQLTTLDPLTGNVLAQRTLVNVRAAWDDHHTAQWMLAGDRIYGNLTGLVFCCDLQGQMQWVRRQIWISPREDRDWPRQWMEPPLLADNRLLAAQPGVKAVECLDPETGRLLWRRVMSDLRRVLGAADGLFVVQTETALLAFAGADGELKWTLPLANSLSAYELGTNTLSIWNTRRENLKDGPWIPECHTVDLGTGKILASQTFAELQSDRPLVGPVVPTQPNRWWLLTGNGDKEPHRTINELREK